VFSPAKRKSAFPSPRFRKSSVAQANRALPAYELADFARSLAHRIAGFPAAGHATVKERVDAVALAPGEDFRRDSDLFGEGVRAPEPQPPGTRRRSARAWQPDPRGRPRHGLTA
jgi:hypothetical protein